MSNLRKQWNDACKAAGLKPITNDTAARIMAIIYEFDREDITHCDKLLEDVRYIQDTYGIYGGACPNYVMSELIKKYVKEIEDNDCESTKWAKKLMIDNYNIKL